MIFITNVFIIQGVPEINVKPKRRDKIDNRHEKNKKTKPWIKVRDPSCVSLALCRYFVPKYSSFFKCPMGS